MDEVIAIVLTASTSLIIYVIVSLLTYWSSNKLQQKYALIEKVWWEKYELFKDINNELSDLLAALIIYKKHNFKEFRSFHDDEDLKRQYYELTSPMKDMGFDVLSMDEYKEQAHLSHLRGSIWAFNKRFRPDENQSPLTETNLCENIMGRAQKTELPYNLMLISFMDLLSEQIHYSVVSLLNKANNMELIIDEPQIFVSISKITDQAMKLSTEGITQGDFDQGLAELSDLVQKCRDIARSELRKTKLAQK